MRQYTVNRLVEMRSVEQFRELTQKEIRNVACGSAGEAITRMIGFNVMGLIPKEELSQFDVAHFAAENKLLGFVRSLQKMKKNNQWQEDLSEETGHPTIHSSSDPSIHHPIVH